MATTITTTYMLMVVPTPLQELGPAWATDLYNLLLNQVDPHDHSAGKGTPVTPAGLNLTSDLSFRGTGVSGNNATYLRSVRFDTQSGTLGANPADRGCVYRNGNELYYTDGTGAAVRLTLNGQVDTSGSGSISGLGGTTAGVAYSNASKTFVFTQAANQAAHIDAGNVLVREAVVAGNAVSLKAPTGLAAGYSVVFPAAVPGATKTNAVVMDSAGNLTVADNPTLTGRYTFQGVNPGNTADTTAGNIRWNGSDVQVAIGGVWRSLSPEILTIGDGVSTFGDYNGTDQTPFTNAIAALPATGGMIFVKRGTYTFTAQLVISKAGVVLFGESRNATIIASSAAGPISIQAAHVQLRNLKITCSFANADTVAVTTAGANAIIDSCWITSTGNGTTLQRCIALIGASDCSITANLVDLSGLTAGASVSGTAIDITTASLTVTTTQQRNRVIGNEVLLPTAGTYGTLIGIGLNATINTAAQAVNVVYNVVVGNNVSGASAGATANYHIMLKTSAGAVGETAVCQDNAVSANVLSGAVAGTTIALSRSASILGTETLTNNGIMGNLQTLSGFAYLGTSPGNTLNTCHLGGNWISTTNGGATNLQIVDLTLQN